MLTRGAGPPAATTRSTTIRWRPGATPRPPKPSGNDDVGEAEVVHRAEELDGVAGLVLGQQRVEARVDERSSPVGVGLRRDRLGHRGVTWIGSRRMPVCLLDRAHSTGPASAKPVHRANSVRYITRELEPGQVGTQAVVDAVAEAEVGVRVAPRIEPHRARRRHARRDWPTPPRTRPCRRRRISASPRTTSRVAVRRLYAAGDVHRTVSSISVGSTASSSTTAAEIVGLLDEHEHAAGGRVARRVGAGREQQREEHVQLLRGELRRSDVALIGVVELGVDHERQHVVARTRTLLGDECRGVRVHRRHRVRHLGRGLERASIAEVEAVLDPLEHPVTIGFGHAEQDADRLQRQLAGEVRDQVPAAARDERRRRAPRHARRARLRARRSSAA